VVAMTDVDLTVQLCFFFIWFPQCLNVCFCSLQVIKSNVSADAAHETLWKMMLKSLLLALDATFLEVIDY